MRRFVLIVCIAAFLIAFEILAATALQAPVAYWKMDEGQDKIVKDYSGNGFDGEIVGAGAWVNGKFDKALELNGTDSEVVIADNDALDGMSQMTIAAWANVTGNGDSSFPRILSKGHEDSWTFLIDIGAGNRLRFIITHLAGKIDLTDTTALTPMFNQYHHYAVVWDGKEVIFYIDGQESSRAGAEAPAGVNTDQPVRIGNSPSGRHFKGIIDDVWLFNRALSVNDIELVMSGNATAIKPAGKLATTWSALKSAI